MGQQAKRTSSWLQRLEEDSHSDSSAEEWTEDLITALEYGCVGERAFGAIDSAEVSRKWAQDFPRATKPPIRPPQSSSQQAASQPGSLQATACLEFDTILGSHKNESDLLLHSLSILPKQSVARGAVGCKSSQEDFSPASKPSRRASLVGLGRIQSIKVPKAPADTIPKEVQEEPRVSNLYGAIHALRRQTSRMAEIMGFNDHADRFADSCIGRLVQHPWYDYVGLVMIVASAVQIGADADRSARTDDSGATLADIAAGNGLCCASLVGFEIVFAVFFTLDLVVRFLGYRKWIFCLADSWFVFDAALVLMMVFFTLILPFAFTSGGDLNKLSGLRLLRLFRLLRMARLLRAFPELLMIVEGLHAAVSAVLWIALLGVANMYVFALAFTMQYHQGSMSDAECLAIDHMDPDHICYYFGSVGKSFLTLFAQGTLLDDLSTPTFTLRHNSGFYTLLWLVYIGISYAMLMNMLIGVLSTVVASTTEGKRKALREQEAKEALLLIFEKMDTDHSGSISKEEFLSLKFEDHVRIALGKLGIEEKHMALYAEIFFRPDEETGAVLELDYQSLLHCLTFVLPNRGLSKLDVKSYGALSSTRRSAMLARLADLAEKLGSFMEAPRFPKTSVPLPKVSQTSCLQCCASDGNEVLTKLHQLPSSALAAELRRRCEERMRSEHKEIDTLLRRATC